MVEESVEEHVGTAGGGLGLLQATVGELILGGGFGSFGGGFCSWVRVNLVKYADPWSSVMPYR